MTDPAVLFQYAMPKQAMTWLAGKIANAEAGAVTTGIIRRFVAHYGVNMAEAAQPAIAAYPSFNAFFTRALHADARPLAPAEFVCPVDGAISQFGIIEGDQIFRPKAITTRPPHWLAAMLHWLRNFSMAALRRSI